MKRAFGILPWVFRSPVPDRRAIIARMVEWSHVARRQGLLGLEAQLDNENDEFIRKGLQLVIDGSEPDQIRGILEVDMDGREAADLRAAKGLRRQWASTRPRWASSVRCSASWP